METGGAPNSSGVKTGYMGPLKHGDGVHGASVKLEEDGVRGASVKLEEDGGYTEHQRSWKKTEGARSINEARKELMPWRISTGCCVKEQALLHGESWAQEVGVLGNPWEGVEDLPWHQGHWNYRKARWLAKGPGRR